MNKEKKMKKGKWQIPEGNHAGNTDSFDFSRSDWQ